MVRLCGYAALCLVLVAWRTDEAPTPDCNKGSFERTATGLTVTPAQGPAQTVRLLVYSDKIIRVTAAPGEWEAAQSLMVVANPKPETNFSIKRRGDTVVLATRGIQAHVSLKTGVVQFHDSTGKPLLSEVSRGKFGPVTEDPSLPAADSYAVQQAFLPNPREALYGLGQHQNGQVNLAGEDVELTTHNLVISIPFVLSTGNYGILWDNNSITHFGDPEPAQPIYKELELFDAAGQPGGLTARYFDGDTLLLERVEADLNYQFLVQGSNREVPLPEVAQQASDLRIEWEGSVVPKRSGLHQFRMYSSGYASLSIDGQERLNRWRVNWNPWYHDTKVELQAGTHHSLKLDWSTQGGYFRLLHRDPLPKAERAQISFASETAKTIDYYFVVGDNADEVIGGYRALTGKAVMLPRWAYGFWQSRERYTSQDQLVAALQEYRDRQIPIDNIVLDWSYWPVDAWGSHQFDPAYFPDPQAMVDAVHELHAQIMISVWPKFYPTTDNYKELNAQGYMLNRNIEEGNRDWIGPGYLNAFYDAFNPDARSMFWRQLDEQLNIYGFDAWWMDAVEPDMHSNLSISKRKELMSPNYLGSGAEVFNAYGLPHADTIYQGDRAADPDQRVFILTRSGYGGIQRAASAIWSGDTVSRWSNLKDQIAAGIGTAMAGVPNWTFDIGGFTAEYPIRWYAGNDDPTVGPYTDMDPALLDEWQELNVRWYQFGAFAPLYRAHGQNPYREIYNLAGEDSPLYESMVWYTKLRYRLLPYIYSLAGDMYHRDGTLMRGLAMDFPQDRQARNLNDQYMFGPAFLVSPVYEMGARSRSVYLPAGTRWYDFYTGERHPGGKTITANAPVGRMPLLVRAGSIVPSGPAIQYSDQVLNAPLTLTVFTGADGSFELYEDDGRTYGYEQGQWSRIPMHYDARRDTLHIGERQGSFPGMAEQRTLHVRFVDGQAFSPADFSSGVSTTVTYSGSALTIPRN